MSLTVKKIKKQIKIHISICIISGIMLFANAIGTNSIMPNSSFLSPQLITDNEIQPILNQISECVHCLENNSSRQEKILALITLRRVAESGYYNPSMLNIFIQFLKEHDQVLHYAAEESLYVICRSGEYKPVIIGLMGLLNENDERVQVIALKTLDAICREAQYNRNIVRGFGQGLLNQSVYNTGFSEVLPVIARIGDPQALMYLQTVLNRVGNDILYKHVQTAIQTIEIARDTLREMTADIMSDDLRVRYKALGAVKELELEGVFPYVVNRLIFDLARNLKNEDPSIRLRAARALGMLKKPQSIGYLIEALENNSNGVKHKRQTQEDNAVNIRIAVVRALGEFGTLNVVPGLRKALKDKNNMVRIRAARALANREITPYIKRTLIAAWWDNRYNPDVRGEIEGVLNNIGMNNFVRLVCKPDKWKTQAPVQLVKSHRNASVKKFGPVKKNNPVQRSALSKLRTEHKFQPPPAVPKRPSGLPLRQELWRIRGMLNPKEDDTLGLRTTVANVVDSSV